MLWSGVSSRAEACYVPPDCDYTVQWGHIKSIIYERTDKYYDLTVPNARHYVAEGVVHHNTGKTWSVLSVIHTVAADYPGLRILFFRKTRKALTNSTLVTFEQEILPLDGMESLARGERRDHRSSYRYPNRTEIVLAGMDDPSPITSSAWDIAFGNEAIDFREEGWDVVGSRLNRPGRDRRFGWLIGDTNPGDPAHWMKKRCDDGRTALWDTGHEANPAMHDGRGWTPAGRDYMGRLKALLGTRRRRYLEGLWAAGEGQWFETFTDQHVSKEAAFNPAYPVHLAVDPGVHTAAVWFQVRGEGADARVTVFGDYYAFNRPAYQNAVAIRDRSLELAGRVDRGTMDPAGKQSTAVGPTVVGEYQRAGLYLDFWPSYPGSVIDGLSLVESFVAVGPPALSVHPDCAHLVDAFANYKRAKRGGQFIDRPHDPQHPYEDPMDALRGGLLDKYPDGRGDYGPTVGVAGPPTPGLHDRRY